MASSHARFAERTSRGGQAVGPLRYVLWQGENGHVYTAWYDGSWHGPLEMRWVASSSPAVAVADSGDELAFWRGSDGRIWEAASVSGSWTSAVDLGWVSSSAPAAAVDPLTGERYVFWRGKDGHVYEAWGGAGWRGPRRMGWIATSAPAVAVTDAGEQYVFWRGPDGELWEARYANGRWTPAIDRGWRSVCGPSVAVNPANGHLYVLRMEADYIDTEFWFNGSWHGCCEWTAGSAAAMAVTDEGNQYFYWQRNLGTAIWQFTI